MAAATLVESSYSDAVELVKQLDEEGYQPSKVVWYYYHDVGVWRLVIAGDEFDKLMPKKETLAYKHIAEAISARSITELSIADVKIVKCDEPLIGVVSSFARTSIDGFVQMEILDSVLNGIFIKEMIIIRSA